MASEAKAHRQGQTKEGQVHSIGKRRWMSNGPECKTHTDFKDEARNVKELEMRYEIILVCTDCSFL